MPPRFSESFMKIKAPNHPFRSAVTRKGLLGDAERGKAEVHFSIYPVIFHFSFSIFHFSLVKQWLCRDSRNVTEPGAERLPHPVQLAAVASLQVL